MDRVLSFVKGDLEQRQMVGQLEHEREQEKENLIRVDGVLSIRWIYGGDTG